MRIWVLGVALSLPVLVAGCSKSDRSCESFSLDEKIKICCDVGAAS